MIAASNAAQEAEDALAVDDLEQAKAAAALAASLVRQPFLPGEDGTWVEGKRREYADVQGRALTVLADASLGLGDAPGAAKWAEQAIALEPFRETGYRRLMKAHIAAGNRAEALQVYERCRHLLAEELGAYPSPETESVYRGLRRRRPDVERRRHLRRSSIASPRVRARDARGPGAKAGASRAAAVVLVAGAVATLLATQGGATRIRGRSPPTPSD